MLVGSKLELNHRYDDFQAPPDCAKQEILEGGSR